MLDTGGSSRSDNAAPGEQLFGFTSKQTTETAKFLRCQAVMYGQRNHAMRKQGSSVLAEYRILGVQWSGAEHEPVPRDTNGDLRGGRFEIFQDFEGSIGRGEDYLMPGRVGTDLPAHNIHLIYKVGQNLGV
jgi:hypothetical protein